MPNNIIITPGSASIQFSGSANNDTIRLQVEASGSVAFYGNSGSLFSITDQLSGSLMSVNDISGLPILEVFSDDRVVMGTVNQNTLVVTGSRVGIGVAQPTTPLQVQGVVSASAFSGSLVGTASNATSASFASTASFVNALTTLTASNVQLNNLTDTTQTNKVLVLDTATNKIFTTASVGGGGGSGNGFPYDGTVTPAIISGSLLISSSINSPLTVSGSVNEFFELEVVNASAGTNASADVVVSSNNTTDFGNYAAFGINSTTYNAGLVGGASDGYIYLTSSVGELDIGHAHPGANANIRLFAGGPNSTATTRVFISSSGNVGIGVSSSLSNRLTIQGNVSASGFSGSFTGPVTNIPELSMAVSGTIPANGTVGVELNLNTANYFSVSASGTGTVTWTLINPPPTGRAQTFVIEYTNGGIKTNTWFTNTRWPAGVAPSLTSASANPDLLGFTTDDAGANWRGVLLQRGSA